MAGQGRTSARTPGAAGSLDLPHDPRAVPQARHLLVRELESAGVSPATVDDVELVVSELVGNAVRHARARTGGTISLHWRISGTRVEVRVHDGGSAGEIRPLAPSQERPNGRGLQIVDLVAAEWGVIQESGGSRAVWARMIAEGSSRAGSGRARPSGMRNTGRLRASSQLARWVGESLPC